MLTGILIAKGLHLFTSTEPAAGQCFLRGTIPPMICSTAGVLLDAQVLRLHSLQVTTVVVAGDTVGSPVLGTFATIFGPGGQAVLPAVASTIRILLEAQMWLVTLHCATIVLAVSSTGRPCLLTPAAILCSWRRAIVPIASSTAGILLDAQVPIIAIHVAAVVMALHPRRGPALLTQTAIICQLRAISPAVRSALGILLHAKMSKKKTAYKLCICSVIRLFTRKPVNHMMTCVWFPRISVLDAQVSIMSLQGATIVRA